MPRRRRRDALVVSAERRRESTDSLGSSGSEIVEEAVSVLPNPRVGEDLTGSSEGEHSELDIIDEGLEDMEGRHTCDWMGSWPEDELTR